MFVVVIVLLVIINKRSPDILATQSHTPKNAGFRGPRKSKSRSDAAA
jgi:hypothetical protein